MKEVILSVGLCAWALASPGFAETDARVAEMRAGCEPLMTVIDSACGAQNFYGCPDGSRFSETFKADGTVSIELNDAEMNPIFFENLATGEGVRRILETRRAFSFSDFLRTGQGRGEATAEIVMMTPFPRSARVTVAASLTGGQRTVDGVSFLDGRAEVGVGLGLGGMMAVTEGPILVDPERRLMIIESATFRFNGAEFPVGEDAVGIVLPGQPGFLPDSASDECQGLLSLATPLPERPHG